MVIFHSYVNLPEGSYFDCCNRFSARLKIIAAPRIPLATVWLAGNTSIAAAVWSLEFSGNGFFGWEE